MITVFFGPPGSGKGTQASVVAARMNVPHVSTGQILRAEVEQGSALGIEAEPLMAGGNLVPDDLIVRVIEKRLSEPDAAGGAILDGFPRTVPQAEALDAMLRRRGWAVNAVVALDVPEDVLLQRILQRGETEGRSDDSAEAFEQRIQIYRADTAPVHDYYVGQGVRVCHVNGVGTVDDVSQRIAGLLKPAANGVDDGDAKGVGVA